MSSSSNPSCSLPRTEQPARRAVLAQLLAAHPARATARERVTLAFDDSDVLGPLAEIVALERRCCSSLSFAIEVSPDGRPESRVRLVIEGPPGTSRLVASWMPELDLVASTT